MYMCPLDFTILQFDSPIRDYFFVRQAYPAVPGLREKTMVAPAFLFFFSEGKFVIKIWRHVFRTSRATETIRTRERATRS